jgi:uncharacterized protein (TIRG00374 family)
VTRARLLQALAFLVGGGLFAGLVYLAGPRALADQVLALGWAGAVLFLVPSLFTYLFEALGWYVCFAGACPVGFWRLFLIRTAGESLNQTLPSAYLGGEPVKALLLQREGGQGAESFATALAGKTALVVGQAVFVALGALCALLVIGQRGGSQELPWVMAGALFVTGALCACLYLAYLGQRQGLGQMTLRFARRTGMGRVFLESRLDAIERFDAALTGFYAEHGRRFWLAVLLCTVGWSFEVAEVLAFCWALDLPITLAVAFAIGAFCTVGKAAGFFLPGGLGAQDGGNVVLFLAFGFTDVLGVAFSVLRRFRELVWVGIGLLLLTWFGVLGRRHAPTPETVGVQAGE